MSTESTTYPPQKNMTVHTSSVENTDKYDTLIPHFDTGTQITKSIFQTYYTKNIPIELKKNIEHLKSLNSDWDYMLYDDNDIEKFILEFYGEPILKYYRKINPEYGAAKADFFRYLLIYKKGGVYIDIKSSLTKSLNDTILDGDTLILSHWDNEKGRTHENWGHYKEIKHIPKGEFQQWHIIASPGHPFLREVIIQVLKNIDHYNPYKFGVGLKGTLKTTGPIMYSLVMNQCCKEYSNYRLVDGVTEIGLKYSIYEDSYDCFYHKNALQSNYNYKISPVINNGYKQNCIYRFYFKHIYRKIEEVEQKKDILMREANNHPNKNTFILKYLKNKLLRAFKLKP